MGPVLLDISHQEFKRVMKNPRLYYFSSALSLHQRLKRLHHAHTHLIAGFKGDDYLAEKSLPYKYQVKSDQALYEVIRLRIRQSNNELALGQSATQFLESTGELPLYTIDGDKDYWAEVIRFQKHFFYRIDNTIVDIDMNEYCQVIENPNLHYRSAAMNLHRRISRINQIKLALNDSI